jgi:hypothetical protein
VFAGPCTLIRQYHRKKSAGENPPDGAMIDYYLNEKAKDVKLEISNSNGQKDFNKEIHKH